MEYSSRQHFLDLPGPILLTGHTGFKGTWMTFLLEYLNVPVIGYSLPAEEDSLYDRAKRIDAIPEMFADIRNYSALEEFIDLHKPPVIIHLAAQPLVLKSYENPHQTFDVNVMGTVNLIDIAFKKDFTKNIIVITTDKVYRNDNSGQAFVETDSLHGKDPYSASKVGTEAVVAAWQQISKVSGGPKVVSVRAGNVIGGGDFASNRLIPDIVKAVGNKNGVLIRNPQSVRPWQHVLEPLVGYLETLKLSQGDLDAGSFNFGPVGKPVTVLEVVEIAKEYFPGTNFVLSDSSTTNLPQMEATNLNLDSSQAKALLNWEPVMNQDQAVRATFQWWSDYFAKGNSPETLCTNEIESFLNEYFRPR